MDVTAQMQRLQRIGYREEQLDRAVVLAGAQLLVYDSLYEAVAVQGLTPEEALTAEACRQAD